MKPVKKPSGFEKQLARVPLYVRLGWGVLLLVGMVSNCARPGTLTAAYVFIFVAICWACVRVMTEAIDAYHTLQLVWKLEEQDQDDEDPPTPPPPAAA